MNELFWLLLPVAAYSGWRAAIKYQSRVQDSDVKDDIPKKSYNEGINNFLDTYRDKAVDIVIEKVDVTSDTIEVHLALGSLYRRNGEVDRAIRIHQNLIEKHAISSKQRALILFELGQDYLTSGLLDRAENIFKDLLNAKEFAQRSLKALIEVYQQEKDWPLAIEYSRKWEAQSGKQLSVNIGQYYCEMAERALQEDDGKESRQLLKQALDADKSCVRANIMLGNLFFEQQDFAAAQKHYLAILDQDRQFISEVIEELVTCLLSHNNKPIMASALPIFNGGFFDSKQNLENDSDINTGTAHQRKAVKFLELHLEQKPSLKLLSNYLYLLLDDSAIKDRQMLTRLKDLITKISKLDAGYRCGQCGFVSHSLHWQCPSCMSWSSIKPT